MNRARPQRFHRRGFTLVELLVASGVTVLLVGFIVAVVSNVSGFWTRSTGRLSAEAQARYALDQITLDLQSAQFRDDGATWLAASVPATTATSALWSVVGATTGNLKPATATGTTLVYRTATIADATFGPAGTWLRFFTTKRGANTVTGTTTDFATVSAPVAVGWQIIRRASATNANNTDRRYFLQRAEVTPANTLATPLDITNAAYVGAAAQPGNTGTLGTARSVRTPQDLGSIIAENVIDFGVYFYTQPARAASSTAPIRIFPSAAETTHLANSPPRIGAATAQFPETADVMIRVLTDEGATLIASYEAGRITAPTGRSNAQYWWDLALAHSRVFTRRILIRAQPL
jgi:Flp pilus assembly pilin Flp